MKKATNRILSFLTAFAMVIGVLVAPFASANAAEETTETVTLHKILQSKENLNAKKDEKDVFPGQKGIDGTEYNGNKIQDIGSYFGTDSEEIEGVYFAVKYNSKDNKGKYVTIKEEAGKDPVFGAVDSLDATEDQLGQGYKLLAGKTEAGGIEFNTKGLKGDFLIEEIHEKSSYVGDKGETLTDMKAVPVEITLPLVNNAGVVTKAHVYPKNIEEKPDTYKDFSKEFKEGQPNGRTDEAKEAAAPEAHNVGDVVDYTVTTKVPAKTKWATAFWDDTMTEGLTFVQRSDAQDKEESDKLYQKGLTIKYDGKEMDSSWYNLDETEKGFTIELTKAGLAEIAKATEDKVIRIDYSATVNEKAVVAIPESNDVTFHYGNNPHKGNTPVPNKPNDSGEMNVKKTWADGVPAAGEWAEFTLYNAQTGKKIGTVKFETKDNDGTLETTTTYTANTDYEPIGNESDNITAPVDENSVTKKGNEWSFKWTGLDKDIEYKVEEKNNMKETATYGIGENGEITVTNNKWNNPEPINPKEPKVVTYGAKFVKTNEDGTVRLPGAEFVVKKSVDGKDKFLTGTGADRAAYDAAQKAFLEAVQAYNNAIKDNKTISVDNTVTIGGTAYDSADAAKAEIAKLEARRDVLWNATLEDMTQWTGTSKDDTKNIKLTSNAEGQFEIAGLAPGTYTLVEVNAPEGYALPSNAEFKFIIEATGKQTVQDIDFGVKTDDTKDDNAQKVINKEVSIPQTGGIGSLIFIVAGLALMGVAFVAMKRRNSYEEA